MAADAGTEVSGCASGLYAVAVQSNPLSRHQTPGLGWSMDQPLRLPEYKNKEVDIHHMNRMNRMMKRAFLIENKILILNRSPMKIR